MNAESNATSVSCSLEMADSNEEEKIIAIQCRWVRKRYKIRYEECS